MRDFRRRAKHSSGREREVAGLLRALADRVEDGAAKANLRVELDPSRREIWLIAASVAPVTRGR